MVFDITPRNLFSNSSLCVFKLGLFFFPRYKCPIVGLATRMERTCVGTCTSCSTAITKHTVCNTGSINIFGQQLTLCYTTMHGVQEWDNIRTFLNYIRNTHNTL